MRLRIRCITKLWVRYSSYTIVSMIISPLFSLPGHSGAPTTAIKRVGYDEGYRDDGSRVMTCFSEDEETGFEYPLDVELIDANPIFDFHGT